MSPRANRQQGFTLIELMIAGAIAVVVLTGATLVAVQAAASARRTRTQNELRRSAALTLDQLGAELRTAGLGRPRGKRKTNTDVFPAAILSATPTSVSFIADVPRPDSALTGFSRVPDDVTTALSVPPGTRDPSGLPVLNELNNGCDIRASLGIPACDSTLASMVAPAGTPDCYGASGASASCPWALGKYRAGEFLLVQDGDGSWSEVQLDSTHAYAAFTVGVASRYMLKLSAANATLLSTATGAFVSSPDRLFYDFDSATGKLTREQCWASVGMPLSLTRASSCAGGNTTGAEVLATRLSSFSLDYLDAGGASLLSAGAVPAAKLALIRRVRIAMTLRGWSSADAPSETFTTDVFLREN